MLIDCKFDGCRAGRSHSKGVRQAVGALIGGGLGKLSPEAALAAITAGAERSPIPVYLYLLPEGSP